MKKILIAATIIAVATPALCCTFNTDCYPGSVCVKRSGQYEGVCVGGIAPGNQNDSTYRTNNIPQNQRTYDDINRTYGNTCSFDTDCGPGYACVKGGGIQGTCMRR